MKRVSIQTGLTVVAGTMLAAVAVTGALWGNPGGRDSGVLAQARLPANVAMTFQAERGDVNRTVIVRSQRQLIDAVDNPDFDLIVCAAPIQISQTVDLKSKDVIAGPRAFEFLSEGRLLNGRSISRFTPRGRYPVFINARVGFWVWYTGKVTYKGKHYAPLPGQGQLPSVLGAWNNQERDITMWSQYHEGKHNDAIEAAQNSLPGKGDLADRFGCIRLPPGRISLSRPLYYTAGMRILGNDGPSNAYTSLSVSESFADPDRLYDIPEKFAIVGIPQNRNNPSRVRNGGGGGDGKSAFDCSIRNLRVETNGRANGVLVHASRGSEISNVHVKGGAPGYRAWVIRGSDDFKLFNTWADGPFDVCYDLIGTCLNVDIDGSRTNKAPNSIGYRIAGNGRLGAIRINNANIEHTGLPFEVYDPRGVRITNFSAQGATDGSPVAVIHLANSKKSPNQELILQGSVTKGFDRIHIARSGKTAVWRIKTRRIENEGFDYDWESARWAGVDFRLRPEIETPGRRPLGQ